MNSFNHYSFGAVSSWMYNYSLGIQRSPEHAGFKHFILKPTPDPDKVITFAKGHYDSVYGRIKSEWRTENGKLSCKCTVPPNSTVTLYLLAKSVGQITESGKTISNWKGINLDGENVIIPLSSGAYAFEER